MKGERQIYLIQNGIVLLLVLLVMFASWQLREATKQVLEDYKENVRSIVNF